MMCYDNSEMLNRLTNLMANHKPLALTSPKQRQGSLFEQQACEFLQAQGLVLVAQNWQQPKVGELDLVMVEKGSAWSTLVFIEVRQRQRSNFGDAAVSVTPSKQRKIIKVARYFLQQHPTYHNCECRFDVISYNTTDKNNKKNEPPEWLQGAFISAAW
ncbi:MAG: YraN family protein [Psychrobacter sp.]|nr:YraN family protein [Psychrobacter sp.]